MKKLVSILICAVLVLTSAAPAFGTDAPPDLNAEGAVVMDITTGDILFEKGADKRLYPASLTKILTALLVIETLSLGKTLVADDEVASTGGSRLKMKAGEEIGAKDALYLLMIGSCNDLAVLFAKTISGSVSEFAKLMNERAKELGCQGSHFVNPNGLHDDDHYTTAYDMALITRYCMQNSVFRDIVGRSEYVYKRGKGAASPGTEETVKNTNWLLADTTHTMYVDGKKRTPRYEGCIGIKTGQTSQAKGCLAAAAVRGSTTILTIVLGADGDSYGSYERFVDSILLLDWGLDNFYTHAVLRMGTDVGTIKVKKGTVSKVGAVLAEDIYTTLEREQDNSTITYEVELNSSITAPVAQGVVCGAVNVFLDGNRIAQYDVLTASKVDKGGILSNFGIEDAAAKKIGRAVLIIVILLIVLFVGYIGYLKVKSERMKKRKAERARARKEAEERDRENGFL